MCVCGSSGPTLDISGKTSDMCQAVYGEFENHGYVPQRLGINEYGDYIDISICTNCGRLQGIDFPLNPDDVIAAIEEM